MTASRSSGTRVSYARASRRDAARRPHSSTGGGNFISRSSSFLRTLYCSEYRICIVCVLIKNSESSSFECYISPKFETRDPTLKVAKD